MDADHVAKVDDFVRRFFTGSDFFDVDESTAEMPILGANLSRSTRSFGKGQKVYVYDVYWGMNERARVIGRYRGKHRVIDGVCPISALTNARPQIVADPAFIRALAGRWVRGGVFVRFLELPGNPTRFDDYRRTVLGNDEGAVR